MLSISLNIIFIFLITCTYSEPVNEQVSVEFLFEIKDLTKFLFQFMQTHIITTKERRISC